MSARGSFFCAVACFSMRAQSDDCFKHSLGPGPVLRPLRAWPPRASIRGERLPQEKIFDNGTIARGKASSAVTAGHPLVSNRLWPDFDFDDMVECIAVRAVEMNPRGFRYMWPILCPRSFFAIISSP